MVTVIGTEKRTSPEKGEFNVLILQGGIEIVKSQKTGKPYMTAHEASIPCTFNEAQAKKLVGTTLPGQVVKEKCEPYDYTIPETKEVVKLDFTYRYAQEGVTMEEAVFA